MDIRENAAKYYDLSPQFPQDLPFYEQLIPSPDAQILELGCGTGRILVPLSRKCGFIVGVDSSKAMLVRCASKLEADVSSERKASIIQADIASLRLQERFDLIIAPFRVFQNLISDDAVNGFFDTVRHHLAPGASAIINAFRPSMVPDEMRRNWRSEGEHLSWEVPFEGGKVTMHDRRTAIDPDRHIIYPELVYRLFEDERLIDEVVLSIAMRCYYPEELLELVKSQDFQILDRWGGYAGEEYGEGSELVIRFGAGA